MVKFCRYKIIVAKIVFFLEIDKFFGVFHFI